MGLSSARVFWKGRGVTHRLAGASNVASLMLIAIRERVDVRVVKKRVVAVAPREHLRGIGSGVSGTRRDGVISTGLPGGYWELQI